MYPSLQQRFHILRYSLLVTHRRGLCSNVTQVTLPAIEVPFSTSFTSSFSLPRPLLGLTGALSGSVLTKYKYEGRNDDEGLFVQTSLAHFSPAFSTTILAYLGPFILLCFERSPSSLDEVVSDMYEVSLSPTCLMVLLLFSFVFVGPMTFLFTSWKL